MSRLLLDENFPRIAAAGLIAAGHDVVSVAVATPGLGDRDVLALARSERRYLLTFDADFGDLVFQRGEVAPPAILYFRLHPKAPGEVLTMALAVLESVPDGHFMVVMRDGVRRRRFALIDTSGASVS